LSHSTNCQDCQQNPCCCPSSNNNTNTITNNPVNTNTFNPIITVNPVFNPPSNGGNGGNVTVTSGPIFRNADTSFIQVSVLNVTDSPQTVTVSILNWENICPPEEFPKFGFLCGEIVNEPDNGNGITVQQNGNGNGNGNGDEDLFFPPEGFIPVLTPFTFTIPARQLFSIQAYPSDPIHPSDPIYEVNVTYPIDPVIPSDPFHPGDPVRFNTWGIDGFGVIQTGNTVLHHQFTRILHPIDPI
jgi:hypothetical protein